MKTRTLLSILILVLAVLIMTLSPWGQVQSDDADKNRPTGKVIFEIGQEDKSDREFRLSGLSGIKEYRCRIGVDCSTEAFPAYLILAGYPGYDSGGVERIIIIFKLDRSYNNVVLRLARGGDETTLVIVDKKVKHLVTNTMLGSGEGFRVGVYNLTLGALKKGRHTIEMTVADDRKGNYVYQWDALSLFAE
jgi:hypothetical protein